MGLFSDVVSKGYKWADKNLAAGALPGGSEFSGEAVGRTALNWGSGGYAIPLTAGYDALNAGYGALTSEPGEPKGSAAMRREITHGYLNPQDTAAYAAAAREAAARSAESRQMTEAAYADRGLGGSGYETAAQQQVGMNQQRALGDSIQDIQARYLAAALGLREQDLARSAAREQAQYGLAGDFLGGAGEVGAAAI